MKLLSKSLMIPATFCLLTAQAVANENNSDLEARDAVFEWINKNMIGRTLVTPEKTSLIANDTVEAVFSNKTMFTNLKKTDRGLSYDWIWVVEQDNYDLDNEKKRTGKPKNHDRAGVSRLEARVSKSTGELIGISRGLSNSIVDVTGTGTRVKLALDRDKLILNEYFINYGDFFDAGGGFKPGGSIGMTTYWIENDKLHMESKSTGYNLNPETLEKTGVSSTWENLIKEE